MNENESSSTPIVPGDGRTAHEDTFIRDRLPPKELWPKIDFSALAELAAYPNRMNAAGVLLDQAIETNRWHDRPCLQYDETRWSYDDLRRMVDRICHVLIDQMGVRSGNRVLLHGPNNPMMAACWFAVLKVGAIAVATMPLLRSRELQFIIEKAQIRHALCDVALADELRAAQSRTTLLETIHYFSATGVSEDRRVTLDILAAQAESRFEAVDTASDDVALVAFTSGTTGVPKATVHFHRDILAMCDAFPRHVCPTDPDDIYVGSPPLAFTFGLGAQLCFPMRSGSSVVYYPGPPGAEALAKIVADKRCTTLYTAPIIFRQLAELARVGEYDLSSLRRCVSAGETLPLPTFEAFRDAVGVKIIDGLGSTEMIHIFIAASDDDIRPGATGMAIPGYEAVIMDDEGRILDPPVEGLLAVRGPTGCRYLDDEIRQGAYVRDGWNLPGDRYRQDADGYFWYVARADDMIISAGYNIGGPEVEAALLDHPKVAECAVIGAPDAERGTIVKAFVVLRDPNDGGEESVKELQAFVREEIAPYKYPRAIEFVDALPRTETGKVQRFKLREMERDRTEI